MFEPPAAPPRPHDDLERFTTDAQLLSERGSDASGTPSWKKRAGGAAIGLGVLLAKIKTVLLFLLPAKGILLSGASLIASVWLYTQFYGFKFAVAFVLLIAVHELGHVVCIRIAGLPGGIPYFIPGLGAFTPLGGKPASAYQSAWIAFGGPLFGAAGAGVCLVYGALEHDAFGYAVASTGFLMNFFNMMPIPPFDGGRIVEAVSPRVWIAGLVLFAIGAIAFHIFANPLIVILVLLSIPQAIKAWRGELDRTFHDLTAVQRVTVAFGYFALSAAMLALYLASYHPASAPTLG